MLERAFDRFRVVDKLKIGIIGEDRRRQALPGDIGSAVQAHAKLELLMLCRGAGSANARGHFLQESLAIAHEQLRLGDPRFEHRGIERGVA
jgi:hypothetical protein